MARPDEMTHHVPSSVPPRQPYETWIDNRSILKPAHKDPLSAQKANIADAVQPKIAQSAGTDTRVESIHVML